MRKPVTIEALTARLELMGFVIAPHGEQIGVRLPLMTSVRVGVTDGRLSLEPHFGPLKRTHATVVKTLGLTALGFFSLLPVFPVPAGFAIVFLALALWGYDAVRYTLTESCSAQVRNVFGALLDESAPVLPTRTYSQTRALDGGDPGFVLRDSRVHTRAR
ncbi:MAG: hypothetical protein ABIY52_02565 [Gemmatimonadaceae bacterium]